MDHMIDLYLGDCLDVMRQIVQPVDAIITDPPYEINNSGGGMMARDNRKFIEEIDSMGMCKSNFDVHNFLNVTLQKFETKQKFCGVFFCSMKQVADYLNWAKQNKLQHGLGVWHKSNPAPLCNNKYLNDVEYWIYIKGSLSKIGGSYKSKSLVYQSSINKADKVLYKHPTIKPITIIEKFLINHTNEGCTVLDPFMGSGTTGVACKNLNRHFIGIEQDANYFEIAKGRINE